MENKILIFRTSITRKCDIKRIEKLLAQYPQIDKWNVDFEDWEKMCIRDRYNDPGPLSWQDYEVLASARLYIREVDIPHYATPKHR